jgi:ribosomal protein S18 acetylase RimI-like enzyme
MPVSVRQLLDSDLEIAEHILQSAFMRTTGWKEDLLLYQKIQPDGYFLAEMDGMAVGMVGTTIYPSFAYVGMMAVLPTCQRLGIGSILMEHLLAWLDRRIVPIVFLDASSAGQPLYERLGFVPYQNVEIYERRGGQPIWASPPHVKLISGLDLDLIRAHDLGAFGTDRSRVLHLLLETYPGRAFLLPGESGKINGYLFAQENRIGPWVMKDGDAEELLQAALSRPFRDAISLAVPEENTEAIALLRRYGFKSIRVNRHMGRGSGALPGVREQIFGQTSLSLG